MTARDDLYNYADDAHLGGDYLDELLDRVEAESVASLKDRADALIATAQRVANALIVSGGDAAEGGEDLQRAIDTYEGDRR